MVDMNAEMYRCCGHTVEISGFSVDLGDGQVGHRIHCELCQDSFTVPGDFASAREAVPVHFLEKHQLKGKLDDWYP